MSPNQHVVVVYPCGCQWAFPSSVDHLRRNCPEHWPADNGYKLHPKTAAPTDAKDGAG